MPRASYDRTLLIGLPLTRVLGLGSGEVTGSWVLDPARGLSLGSSGLGSARGRLFCILGSETTKKRKIAFFFLSPFPQKLPGGLYFLCILVRIGVGQRCWFGVESHRLFGYSTKFSVTYGARSARRIF